jgi:alpha-N-arabinofuranosidase
MSIALVNRHPQEIAACTIHLKGKLLEGSYEATVLAGDSTDAYNDIENPNRVVPIKTKITFAKGVVDLPPHSLVIVKLRQ